MLGTGLEEYIFTAGMTVSFIGMVAGIVYGRKHILKAFEHTHVNRSDILLALVIALGFIALDIALVRPTQLLFFDDAIYQAMALSLIHTGQAWMCNYGTPVQCFSGQVYHEPIGLAFNIALGFLVHGVNRGSAYGTQIALAALSVFLVFPVSLMLLNDKRSAYFAELVLALSPVVLVWAMPTNSDMAGLAYSLVAVLMLLVFARKRNNVTLMNLVLSVAVLMYMKVDYAVYIPLFAIMLVMLYDHRKSNNMARLRRIGALFLDSKFLLVMLISVILIYPLIVYAWSEYNTGDYGYAGTQLQLSCASGYKYMNATGNINIGNFKANICSSALFWVDKYASQDIVQPVLYTVLGVAGAVVLFFKQRRALAAIFVWFMVIFLLYAAFYAGSPTYGVDWRFQLSLIAQVAILAGATLGWVSGAAESIGKNKIVAPAVIAAIVIVLAVQTYLIAPIISVNPASIQQAGNARFYENFVYANAAKIPNSCIVYTYDPTLFNINGKTATQMSNIYNASFYAAAQSKYGCSIFDKGYWCGTPNNLCTSAEGTFNMTPIATATYNGTGFTYGLYRIGNGTGSS